MQHSHARVVQSNHALAQQWDWVHVSVKLYAIVDIATVAMLTICQGAWDSRTFICAHCDTSLLAYIMGTALAVISLLSLAHYTLSQRLFVLALRKIWSILAAGVVLCVGLLLWMSSRSLPWALGAVTGVLWANVLVWSIAYQREVSRGLASGVVPQLWSEW